MNYSTVDYEGYRLAMISLLQEKLPEYTDTSSSDAGIVLIELFASMLDIISYYNNIVANEALSPTARERGSVIEHTKALGYTMQSATPSQFYQVFEIVPKSEDFTIPKGFRVKTPRSGTEGPIYFETDSDITIPAGSTGLEKDLQGNYLYQVSITQGYSVVGDVIGTSTGVEDQYFYLNSKPVIDSSVSINVNEGTGSITWIRVDNFIDSVATSGSYTVSTEEDDTVKITFGDGSSGKIPAPYLGGISANYRVGGGVIGNVGPNTISEVVETKSGILRTFNPSSAYVLGAEKEDIDVAKLKAVSQIKSLWRAVTTSDFESLALSNLEVLKAKAIATNSTRTVDVYLLPKNSDLLTPDEVLANSDFFNERSLIGVTVNVHSPYYVGIYPLLTVRVSPVYASQLERIKLEIDSYIRNDLFKLGNYDFGQPFIAYDLIQRVMKIEGVMSVYLYTDQSGSIVPLQDSEVSDNQIVVLDNSFDINTAVTFTGV